MHAMREDQLQDSLRKQLPAILLELFSVPPKLELEHTSPLTLSHWHYLDPSPSTAAYLQLAQIPDETLFREWQSIAASGNSPSSHRIEWSCEAADEVRARIFVDAENTMCVDLICDGELPHIEDVRWDIPDPTDLTWKFLTLTAPKSLPAFSPSLADALRLSKSSLRALVMPSESSRSNKRPTKPEQADGEGTTPGAYSAAEDFWAGWDDGPSASTSSSSPISSTGPRAPSFSAEDDYWRGYSDVESAISDARQQPQIRRKVEESDIGSDRSSRTREPTYRPQPINRSPRSSNIKPPASQTSKESSPSASSRAPNPLSSTLENDTKLSHDQLNEGLRATVRGLWQIHQTSKFSRDVEQEKERFLQLISEAIEAA